MAYFDPDYLKMDSLSKVAPKRMLEWFASPEGKWFRKELNDDGTPDAEIRKDYEQNWLRRVRQVVAYLASKDANFVFGTDTPSSPTYGNLPGLNGYMEMLDLRKAGMSLAQIFRAATISNARQFKLESQLGSIEPGKIANLVLLKRSPLESVDAYDSIATVFVHGQAISRASLSADSNGASAAPVVARWPHRECTSGANRRRSGSWPHIGGEFEEFSKPAGPILRDDYLRCPCWTRTIETR
jgi:hypothetical protein